MSTIMSVTTELATIFPKRARLKLRCSVINKQLLCNRIKNKEKVMNDFVPTFFSVISSDSPSMLWGIVILLIKGFTKAISIVAVEWNPKLPEKRSMENPSKKA